MEGELNLRALAPGDVAAVLEIHQASPKAAQWARVDYEQVEAVGARAWVVGKAGKVVGFLVARAVTDEMEILNLAVVPQERRKGAGRRLVREALAWGKSQGARRAFLEVRESNRSALEFYGRLGFSVVQRRARYYRCPVEDALLLCSSLL